MAVEAFVVDGVLGWKLDSEKNYAVIGLETSGSELQIAVAERHLVDVVAGLINASGAFPLEPGLKLKQVIGLSPTEIEVGRDEASGDLSLSVVFPSKGHLTFRINRRIAQGLRRALDHTLGDDDATASGRGGSC